jgi:hypothetical protein
MGKIIDINTDDMVPRYKQIDYKVGRALLYLDEISIGYRMLQDNEDVETAEFLIEGGLDLARSFLEDVRSLTNGPKFIDWM